MTMSGQMKPISQSDGSSKAKLVCSNYMPIQKFNKSLPSFVPFLASNQPPRISLSTHWGHTEDKSNDTTLCRLYHSYLLLVLNIAPSQPELKPPFIFYVYLSKVQLQQLIYLNTSIQELTENNQLDTVQMSPMDSLLAGQNLTNDTLPKSWGHRDSTYVSYSLIHVLTQMQCGKLKGAFGLLFYQLCAHTTNALSQKIAGGMNIFLHLRIFINFVFLPLLPSGQAQLGPLVKYKIEAVHGTKPTLCCWRLRLIGLIHFSDWK